MSDERRPEAGFDLRLAKAMAHPLRQQLLMAYAQGEWSPSELAVSLGRPLNEVAYHTKRLLEMEYIELVRTERGPGIKHFYRALRGNELDDSSWRRLPPAVRRSIAFPILEQVVQEAAQAASRGALETADMHITRVPLELDDAAWAELSELLVEVVERARALSQASARRRTSRSVARPSVLGILHLPRG